MEEGQLKKRMKEIKLDATSEAGKAMVETPPITEEHLRKLDIFGNIDRLFDEAKKEFPIEIVLYKGEIGFNFYEPKHAEKKLGEAVLWFVKWFGGEKE